MRARLTARLAADDRGFTLVEMMVSILLLAIIFSAMVTVIATSLRSMSREEQRVRATQLAQEELERLRAITWDCAGFDVADGDYASTYTNPAGETFATVGIDTSVTCTSPPTVPADTSQPVTDPSPYGRTIDGITYTVTPHIYWMDDPEDGTAPADTEPNDYKEFTVDVAWNYRGEANTYSNSSTRVPTVGEVPLSSAPVAGFEITSLTVTPENVEVSAGNATAEAFTVDVTTSEAASSVTLEIPGVYGPMAMGGSGTTWTRTIPVGTNAPPGTYAVDVDATSGTGNDAASGSVIFAQAAATPVVINTPLLSPGAPICVASNGDSLRAVTVRVDVQGVSASDTVTVAWTNQSGSVAASPRGATANGHTFEATIPSGTKFNRTTTTVTVTGKRTSDGVTAQGAYTYTVKKGAISVAGLCI